MNACQQKYKFAGYERDSETGLDYAIARYYNSRFGRFMSPDPMAGVTSSPQFLNRYACVLNNPSSASIPWDSRHTYSYRLLRPALPNAVLETSPLA